MDEKDGRAGGERTAERGREDGRAVSKFNLDAINKEKFARIKKKQYFCSMKRKFIQILTWLGVMSALTLVALGVWMTGWAGNQNTTSLKWLQMLQTCATFLLPPVICAWMWDEEHKPFRWLQMDRGASWQVFALAIAAMVCAIPAINLLADLNSRFLDRLPVSADWSKGVIGWMKAREEEATALTERFLAADSIGGLMVNIGLMAVLPAVAEEMSFRGVLQGVINSPTPTLPRREGESNPTPTLPPREGERRKTHIAIWVTAFVFSAIHVQFYGFIPRMLMGAMFGYVLVWTGSLWVPVVMHLTNNAVAVVSYQLSDVSRQPSETSIADTIGAGDTWWVGLISLIAVCWLLWLITSQGPRGYGRRTRRE